MSGGIFYTFDEGDVYEAMTEDGQRYTITRPEDVAERGIKFSEGEGMHTNDELSMENEPVSKALEHSRFTRKQRREFAEGLHPSLPDNDFFALRNLHRSIRIAGSDPPYHRA